MKIYFVDSFTNEKFKGNPAAVCFPETDTHLDVDTMQKIATEIGFSETAFVKKISENTYSIRFFTPKIEIPLCGHATLASSKIIFDTTFATNIKFISFHNVELHIEQVGNKIKMQFPVYDTEAIEVPQKMLDALGISECINKRYSATNKIILLEIKSASTLSHLKPDFTALIHSYSGINGVLVTAISDSDEFDFHYRYFWPWAGTNEDPVTGGVQTFLTKYWSIKLNKTKMNAFQSSLRTGSMSLELLHFWRSRNCIRRSINHIAMLIETLKTLFNRDLNRLKNEIELYTDEKYIWKTDRQINNSAGNLCLHLIGNLNTYIGKEIGETGYVRNREQEFSSKNVARQELCEMIDNTIEMINRTLTDLDEGFLEKEYPILVFDQPTSTEYLLVHLTTHLSYHLGQINYHRRFVDNNEHDL